MVSVLVLRSAGANCNDEMAKAFEMAGANAEQVHINEIIAGEKKLRDYDVLALPGGFSYGDYIAAGSILANQLSVKLGKQMEEFVEQGKMVIGICNGFQALVKAGFLPGEGMKATLTDNDSARFECRWVKLIGNGLLAKGMEEFNVPVAHSEGKFVADEETIRKLEENGQILFKYSSSEYPENPNGSKGNIAGLTNKQGNVIGLMPHPERHLTCANHPQSTRIECTEGEGLRFFKNIIEVVKNESILIKNS